MLDAIATMHHDCGRHAPFQRSACTILAVYSLLLGRCIHGIYEPYCKLPADERRILALRYWQKMEVPDVAAELMFSESTVYRHISRALSRLYRPVLEVQPLLEDWRMGALK